MKLYSINVNNDITRQSSIAEPVTHKYYIKVIKKKKKSPCFNSDLYHHEIDFSRNS